MSWTATQTRVVAVAALAIVLDGIDTQLLSVAIPSLVAEWGEPRETFGRILGLGVLGGSLGVFAGPLADRWGRRPIMLLAVGLFASTTIATAFVNSSGVFLAMRVAASIGLAGLIPIAMAMIAEHAPEQDRNFAVTLGVVCIPLGSALCGALGAMILVPLRWKALYLICGGLTLALLPLFATVPETPSFSASLENGSLHQRSMFAGIVNLFAAGQRRDTAMLWIAMFFNLAAVYLLGFWLPTILVAGGYGIAAGSAGFMVFSLGGIVGAIVAARFMRRAGSRRGIAVVASGAVVASLIFAWSPPVSGDGMVGLVIGLVILGGFVAATQTSIYALPAYVYPTYMRATGIAVAVMVGRAGAILSSFQAGRMADLANSSSPFFRITAVCLGIAGAAAFAVRRHVAPVLYRSETVDD